MKKEVTILSFIAFFSVGSMNVNGQTTIFQEDFPSIGNWSVSNGVWQVGVPVSSSGPDSCFSPPRCAGTDSSAFYPNLANTRLVSPLIELTTNLESNEMLQLRFWHWFSISIGDSGVVQISDDDGASWTSLSPPFLVNSSAWTRYIADISPFANSTVRLGLFFKSNSSSTANGWFIDDISIVKTTYALPDTFENFEQGIGEWFTEQGVWEVGTPTSSSGPSDCNSPPNCAGTVLAGFYPNLADTRFISPRIKLIPTSGQIPELFFQHWFSISVGDSAVLQISVEGGPWETISNNFGVNSNWTQFSTGTALSAYIDSTVQFAFYFKSNSSSTANGWFVDDLDIRNVIIPPPVSVEDIFSPPTNFVLQQNYPNPFNPETTIQYSIEQPSPVKITIFNGLGQKVRTLLDQTLVQPGTYSIKWDGKDTNSQPLASGNYYYQIRTRDFVSVKKAILLK